VQVLSIDLDEDDPTRRHPFARLARADRQQLEAGLPVRIQEQPSPDLVCGNCIWRELKKRPAVLRGDILVHQGRRAGVWSVRAGELIAPLRGFALAYRF
jgi:hypothetical protein